MLVKVSEIKNTKAIREHGDVSDLGKSINEVGLINPLTIDSNKNLLAGHRRYQAIRELGWTEVECRVLPVEGDRLKSFRVSIDENMKRKPLTDPEVSASIMEYDEIKRELEGVKSSGPKPQKKGKIKDKKTVQECIDGKPIMSQCDIIENDGWTQEKTANDLGISRTAVIKAIQIATAIKEDPELAKEKSGKAVLHKAKQNKQKKEIEEKCKGFKEVDSIKIIEGDLFKVIDQIPDKSIDLLITDPPYNMNKGDWDNFNQEEFIEFTERWIKSCIPKLKDNFNIFITFNSDYFTDLEVICRKLKLPIQSRLIWHYRNAGGKSQGKYKFSKTYDPIMHIGNKVLNFEDKWDDERFDVWTIAIPQSNFTDGKYHPTQKPMELFEKLIRLGSCEGENVLDCFAGSGTTGMVCKKMSRKCILIERDAEYVKIIKGRLA